MNTKKYQGFTIIELIVVITILAILGTIGFISFSSHLVGTRDTNRLEQLSSIHQGLDTYSTQYTLPMPESYVEVRASGSVIGYQGYIGKNILGQIGYSKGGKDPKDEQSFSYYLTEDKKYFQLLGFLEDQSNLQTYRNPLINQTKAVDYSKRYPTVIGKKLGILTESGTNSPIQEVSSIVSSGYLDVVLTTSNFKAILDDNTIISGTGGKLVNGSVSLSVTNKYNNCKEIIEGNLITKYVDGQYYIYLNGNKIQVYCDMTTGSGGRTMIKRWGRLGRNGKIESDRKGVMVASGQIGDLNDLNLLGTKIAKMSDSMINSIKFTEIMFRQESDNAKVFVYTGSISSDKRITASSSFVYKVGLNGTIKTSSLTSAGGGCTKYGIYISEDTGDGIGNTACGGTFIAQDGGYIHTFDNNGFGVNGAYVYTNKTGDQWVR